MTENRMTCGDFDGLFLEYLEDGLDATTRAVVDAHVASCARCQGLMRDIDGIRAQASSLPELAPSKDLWQGIESRIQPAVVSIGSRRQSAGFSRTVLAAAAAALIVVTSSVTYVATSRTIGKAPRPQRVVEAPRDIPLARATDETGTPAPTAITIEPEGARAAEPTAKPITTAEPSIRSTPKVGRANRMSGGAATALASSASAPTTASELALSSEISQLQTLLRQKRSQLDPTTVQVVEDNLNLIDVAVKQARAALSRDPASGFLTEQLDNVLHKKVELLRTVALLPSKS